MNEMGQNDMTEIYQRLGKIEAMVARIDERTMSGADTRAAFRKELDDHDERLRALEDNESKRAGFNAAIIAIVSIVSGIASFFAAKIGGH